MSDTENTTNSELEILIEENWDNILLTLQFESSISPIVINSWIRPLKIFKAVDHKLYFIMSSPWGSKGPDYIREKMFDCHLKSAIESFLKDNYDVFIISSPEEFDNDLETRADSPNPVNNYSIEESNLIKKYTFDSFVVGDNNRHAHAACVAIAESVATSSNAASSWNPLFLYGGVGLGKTHLMHSIGHYVLQNNKKAKVLYVTSESFTNELIQAIQHNKTEEFRQKYRNIDLLLLDDIQFILDKPSTQTEFFHTFNYLYNAGKQMVISSDKAPKEINSLEERIQSRFQWGLPVDIQSPDYETRMAILRKRADLDKLNVPDTVIQYIAKNIVSNIRELEGALNKISIYSKLDNSPITVEFAENTLRDMLSSPRVEINPSLIMDVVCEHLSVKKEDIISSSRKKEIAIARHICMYLSRTMINLSLEQVGEFMGNRDHTSVMHAERRISSLIKEDPSFADMIETIKKKIDPS